MVSSDDDVVFYNKTSNSSQSVMHQGDNRSGNGDGDDEVIAIDTTKIPSYVDRIVISVTIHDAKNRGQNFGQVSDAYIRIMSPDPKNDFPSFDTKTAKDIARFDLSEDSSNADAFEFGEVYRKDGEWKFRALGKEVQGGIENLFRSHGVAC